MRGKLALAGIDLSTDIGVWLDAVYALWLELPEEARVKKFAAQLERRGAMLRPEEARRTWGRTPVQRALAGDLGQGPAASAGAPDPATLRATWDRLQKTRRTGV